MNIVGKNYVAIFLAATLVTGIFSVIFPSFNDVEASGDRHNDKRHGDKSKSVIVKKFVCNQNNIDVGGY